MEIVVDRAEDGLRVLVDAVSKGEEVILVRDGKPVARVTPVEAAPTSARSFGIGVMADKLRGPIPDFLEPLDSEELALWEGRAEPKE